MSVSPEMIEKVALWRQKARDGTLTQEETREAVQFLRAERMAMPPSPSKAKPTIDANALLGELGI